MTKPALLIFFLIVTMHGLAQTGDFDLKTSPTHYSKNISADPSLKGTGMGHFFIGKNYRKEWISAVEAPALNLDTSFNGLKPEKEGGGKETHTLHLKDGNGNEWVLRSVQKFPQKVITPALKGTVAEDIVCSGISASYPYGALSVATLARAAGVPYFPNTLVYIPDQPQLGKFREKYKNTLSFLELRTVEENTNEKTFDTNEILDSIEKPGNGQVDQQAALNARLLDNFIMDFDRYDGQWSWYQKDSAGRTWYEPIPKDRDQAFFKADGLIPWLISHQPGLGPLQGLKAKPRNIVTFNHSAWQFDRSFLNELDEQAWNAAIDHFLTAMSDSVIGNALHKQPKAIWPYNMWRIIMVLKKKRSFFKKDMMRYYQFLSGKVSIIGTNEADVFTITKNTNGTVTVQVKNGTNATANYTRIFKASATKEIRLYGLGGNDQFIVTGATSPIKIRLIGGEGKDLFNNQSGNGKVFAYDHRSESNEIAGTHVKNKFSADTLTNDYRRSVVEYNHSSIGIRPEYAIDGGLFLGPSFKIITNEFGKEPFASKNDIYVTKAFSSKAWHMHYDAEYIKVTNNIDIVFHGDAKLPTVRTNFFGWGNNTVFNKSRGLNYYNIRYTLVDASLMARHWLMPSFHLEYGPVFEYFKVPATIVSNKFLGTTYPPAFNNALYGEKSYAGAGLKAVLDTKNNNIIPARGIHATAYAEQLYGISNNSKNFTQLGAEVSLYTDVISANRIILATSFGFHSNIGDFEFPQAQYLGFKQNLRGYRYQRFAGRTRAYNNTELRIRLGDANLYLFRGPVGILGFHDVARVWMDKETSHTWHNAYGGGIWLAPFEKIVLAATLAFSKEENALPLITFGFQF